MRMCKYPDKGICNVQMLKMEIQMVKGLKIIQ